MFWSSLLLSVSIYTWYLFFFTSLELELPALFAGPGSLIMISAFPTLAAFIINSYLAGLSRTVLKVLLLNSFLFFMQASAAAWLSGYFIFLPSFSAGFASWLSWLFPFIWQVFSWLCGSAFAPLSSTEGTGRPVPVKVLEAGLLLVVPAVFLLAYADFPALFLAGVIMWWFIVMALALALEGAFLPAKALPRYDLVLFHLLVPVLVGVLFYFAAFSGQFWAVLEESRKALAAVVVLFIRLLSLLDAPEAGEPWEPERDVFYMEERAAEGAAELSPLAFSVLLIAGAVAALLALVSLVSWLMTRLEADPGRRSKKHFSFWKTAVQVWYYMVLLVQQLLGGIRSLGSTMEKLLFLFLIKVKALWLRVLPPRTPYERVRRSYGSFLRWGKKRVGCSIKPWETPLEYLQRLLTSSAGASLPTREMRLLTNLFLEARYSGCPVNWQQAGESLELLRKIARTHLPIAAEGGKKSGECNEEN